jgi:hypothetical protein
MMRDRKKILPVILEFILRNVFFYLIFSLIYLDFNVANWWLIQNPWGRLIIVIFELGLLNMVDKELSKDMDNTDK